MGGGFFNFPICTCDNPVSAQARLPGTEWLKATKRKHCRCSFLPWGSCTHPSFPGRELSPPSSLGQGPSWFVLHPPPRCACAALPISAGFQPLPPPPSRAVTAVSHPGGPLPTRLGPKLSSAGLGAKDQPAPQPHTTLFLTCLPGPGLPASRGPLGPQALVPGLREKHARGA